MIGVDWEAFDIEDFYRRWKCARLSSFSYFVSDQTEKEAILKAQSLNEPAKERILKDVFGKSRKLGMSLAGYLKRSCSLEQTVSLLRQNIDSPCLRGKWDKIKGGQAQKLVRKGCGEFVTPFLCSYWREAIDGLVMGLGLDVRFSRHRSLGHGDDECVDVFYTSAQKYTLGEIPKNLDLSFREIKKRLLNYSEVKMALKGYSEGTLFYTLESVSGSLSPLKARLIQESITRCGEAINPHLQFRNITPRAIF